MTIDEIHAKKLLKEIIIELVRERQDLFYELIDAEWIAAITRGGHHFSSGQSI